MMESLQSRVDLLTDYGGKVPAPCDTDGVLVVAISVSEQLDEAQLCLTITHRPSGRRLGPALPSTAEALERAQVWRDRLLKADVDWYTVRHEVTVLSARAKVEISAVFLEMQDYASASPARGVA